MAERPRYPGGEINFPEINFQNINKKTIYIILLVIFGIWVLSGIYRVDPQEQGVVRLFGQYSSTTGPGLHYRFPWPIEQVDTPLVTLLREVRIGFSEEQSLMLTGDENIVDLDVVVQFQIKDSKQFLFEVRNPIETVQKAAESAIRFVIGRNSIDDALTDNKTAIQEATTQKLQQILDSYSAGISIVNVILQDVNHPNQVAEAFRDVASAIQDRSRRINEAEGYRNNIIPQARGEAEQLVREAEGYMEQRVRRAQGDASRFISVFEEYNKSRDVTRTRLYLETMVEILPGMDKYIIQSDQSGGIINLLNLNKGGGQ